MISFLSYLVPIILVSSLSLSLIKAFATAVASLRSSSTCFVHLDDVEDDTKPSSRTRRPYQEMIWKIRIHIAKLLSQMECFSSYLFFII
jgi:hypothetical protein